MSLLVCWLLAAAPAPTMPVKDAPRTVNVAPQNAAPGGVGGKTGHASGTQCAACHSTQGWTQVKFNHDRTGFALEGQHATVSCKACHTASFDRPVARTCSGCHRDVHAGELGARCESCHDASSWRSRVDAEAHRRTNFPLLGGHAALPCVECHFEARERRFSRAAVDCGSCHQLDYQRTAMTSVNHAALSFDPQKCRSCHGAYRFTPALYPGHEACYPLQGAHATFACAKCHGSFTGVATGSCSTGAQCMTCHTCSSQGVTETDKKHAPNGGYRCVDTQCYECHKTALGGR